jgi:subtilase family serine protease
MQRSRLILWAGAALALCQVAGAQTFKSELLAPQLARVNANIPEAVSRSIFVKQADPNQVLHLSVSLPYGDPEGMQAFVDSVSNPKSPSFHKFITPDQVGQRFGLPYNRVQDVVNYLSSQGMKIRLVGKNRLSVLADATVGQAQAAFHTSIHHYRAMFKEAGRSDFYSISQPAHVPVSIAPYILDIEGLENFTQPQHRALTPTQTRTLYNLAPIYNAGMHGENRTVAISSWDGFRLSNVPLYYSHFGLPTPPGGVNSNVTVIPISGGAGSGNPGAEGDLDIQMVLGMAPLCNFRVYDGGASDLIGVLTAEVNDNLADVISESYGWNIAASTATSAHNLHLSMNAQGITYMAASGDNGTTLEPYSYPNYEPEVLQVGGTVATVDTNGNRTSEVGWSGSGGGWSTNAATFNTRPSWQVGNGVPTNINFRMCPDVSLHASSSTGAYQFYLNGSLSSAYVGTSFASPVYAGALAVAEQKIIAQGGLPPNGAGKQRFGRIQDLIYAQNGRSDVWLDITSGANGTLPNGSASNCTPGWDMVTGWGPINFDAFVASQVVTTVPNAPTALAATRGNAQVSLTWTGRAGATSYNVKRGSASGGPYSTVGSPTGTSFTDSGLTNGTTYFYVVTAVNSVGESGNSNEASATPAAPAPDFSMASTPASSSVVQGNGTTYSTTVTALNGYTGTVSFSSSALPSGASGSFSPTSVAGSGSTTFSVSTAASTPAGSYPITISGSDGTITHTNSVTLVVTAPVPPDFTIAASPASASVGRNSSVNYTITITGNNGFSGATALSVTGVPASTTATFTPASVTGSGTSTMKITTTSSSPKGTFTLTVKGTSGSLSHTTTVSLTIRQH